MKSLFHVFVLTIFSTVTHAQLVTYIAPDSLKPSEFYQVKANGKPLFVYQNEVSSLAYFSFQGKVEIEITCSYDVKWVDVRPKNLNIPVIFTGHSIKFSIYKACNLSIELNGEMSRPLYLFAAPLEVKPLNLGKKIHFFEGGKIHNVGVLKLDSEETIYIEGGAVVRGVIVGNGAKNIKIRGRGILDGTYVHSRMIELTNCENIEIEGIIMLNSPGWTLVPKNCKYLNVNNIKQVCWKNGSDGIDIVACSHVKVNDSFFRNNDDNIVLKCWGSDEKYPKNAPRGSDMTDIHIDNSVFWNMPWGNALEIGFELRCGSINNIRFTNCDLIHVERGAALSIHNGDYATVENILYENIRIEDTMQKLLDLSIFLSQYSLDRIASDSLRKERYMHGAWDGVSTVSEAQKSEYASNRGKIRNIIFRNISISDGQFPYSILSGYDTNHLVENVLIENLIIHGKKIKSVKEGRIFMEHTKNITIK